MHSVHPTRHIIPFFSSASVCGPSTYPATAGLPLVRRTAGLQAQDPDDESVGNHQGRGSVSLLLRPLHDRPDVILGKANEEALYEVPHPFLILSLLPL